MKIGRTVKHLAIAGLASVVLATTIMYGPAAVDSLKGGKAMAATVTQDQTQRTISVSGEGVITIQPDVAYINFGVMHKAKTAKDAQAGSAKAFAAVEKVLKEQFKLKTADIQTTGFYVQPEYNWTEKDGSYITGYTASHSIKVTYRNLDQIGSLLDAVSQAGANQVNGVHFSTEKTQAYELQAIEKAMANARQKADTIAKSASASVKGVLHVQHGSAGGISSPMPYPIMQRDAYASEASPSTSIQPGEIELTATVSVTFEM